MTGIWTNYTGFNQKIIGVPGGGRQGSIPSKDKDTVQIAFQTLALRKFCENEEEAQAEFGLECAGLLKHRLADMESASSPFDLLAGKPVMDSKTGEISIELSSGYTVVIKPNHPKCPKGAGDEIDWAKVSRVKIVSIERKNG
jgi:hypothetical protein